MSAVRKSPAVYAKASDEDAVRAAALKRLKKKRDFKGHVLVYLVVNAGLWAIWVVIGALNGFVWPWPAVVTAFWGVFVLVGARETYWTRPISEQDIEIEVERMKGSAT